MDVMSMVMSGRSGQDEDITTVTNSKEVVLEGGRGDDHEGPLPGFRFHPTDEELVSFYLKRKVYYKKPLSIDIIKQIDIYKHDPWDLAKCGSSVGDKEWYFYCKRGRKYRNSVRPNRVTGSGFWKATGIDRPIYSNGGEAQQCVGLKKSLVYYRGRAGKGTKTDWMMHEFRLPTDLRSPNKSVHLDAAAELWTLCRILKRSKRLTPNWRELPVQKNDQNSSSKPNNIVDSSPNHERYISFITHPTTPPATYTTANQSVHRTGETNQYAAEDNQPHCNSVAQSSTPSASNSSSLNVGEDYENDLRYFYGGNWDDLNSVVEFGVRTPTL